MVSRADLPKLRIGRAASRTFKALFAVAVVIAASGTYAAVTDSRPSSAGSPTLLGLIVANLFIISALAAILVARVLQLAAENRATQGGARLRLRIIGLFAVSAAVPTVIVAGFLALMINRNVESWFSAPVYAIVESGRDAAKATIDDLTESAEKETRAMMSDFTAGCVGTCLSDPALIAAFVRTQAEYRDFRRVTAFDAAGRNLFELVAPTGAPAAASPRAVDWNEARQSRISIWTDATAVRVFFRLTPDIYLYASRKVPDEIGARLLQTQSHLDAIREAEKKSDRLRAVLLMTYVEAALLMLLGTVWLGVTASARIAMPIGRLAAAARMVRDGDLTVRLERPRERDEIDDLAAAFNEMTQRISRQTADLERSRIEAENRSAFIEAVLANVEAGVIRVDAACGVTVANLSAQRMLGVSWPCGAEAAQLSCFAPELEAPAVRALEAGQSREANVRRASDNGVHHFHVRVTPEQDGAGAVITFHDTTRLVAGQRQAAWRDVARRIAHEIRNPLTPIQLSAERLRRRFASQIETDRETFDRCTDTIMRQVGDIGRMVEEFSSFARMPKPTFGEFDLIETVEAVAFAQRMATPGIAIQVERTLPRLEMKGDGRLIGQALTNVVKNAAEAVEARMQSDPSVPGVVCLDVRREQETVQITVRDTGPGFPVENRDRLLEPYVTTRRSGVGLGLAIVSRIVEDHGGQIALGDNERAGRGARVEIKLPVEPVRIEEFLATADEGVA